MRRRITACVLTCCACACSTFPSPARDHSGPIGQSNLAPERMIVAAVANEPQPFLVRAGGTPRGYDGFTTYAATARARRLMRAIEGDHHLREFNSWPIGPLHMHCAVLEIPPGSDRVTILAALQLDPRVKLAQPLQTFATSTNVYNDPYVSLQRGFQQMNVPEAHSLSRGEGVRVAIIDTGADTAHPDLAGNIASTANLVDSDAAKFRRDRHGTEIAGVIGAVANNGLGIVGVAPAARLLVFKACWQAHPDADAASCNSFTLARAFAAALDAHVQVVNLSLVGPADPLLSDLIREGQHRGILIVGAAYSAPDGQQSLLHDMGAIEVASTDSSTAPQDVVYALGREILTFLPGGRYDFASGDSIATAQVTGVVALLLARDPHISAHDALRILRSTSKHYGTGPGEEYVDAYAAVTTYMSEKH